MDFSEINARIGEIAAVAASENGVEFVQSEISGTKRNPTVRIYIDKPAGVSLEDCTAMSRTMEVVLDANAFIPHSYTLEVSSPGLERGLFNLSDFERFTGHKVRVKTSREFGGRNSFGGKIIGVEGDEIILDGRPRGVVRIPYDSVAKANLRVDLEQEFKRR